ncbi:MAG: hypothetical protein VYC17_00150 [Nitrospinota bacterium]|nr:hypothetical protein [Nitrospinota bacterium]
MESGQVEESIKQSIHKYGFPDKIVRLPFKPVYDRCKKNGTALNEVLGNLKTENIIGEIQGNHIVFHSREKPLPRKEENASGQKGAWDFSGLRDFANLENIRELASDQLAKLTPEQLAEIRKLAEHLSPDQKARMMELFSRIIKPKP